MTSFSVSATDGAGPFGGYLATPAGSGKAPAVILIQEIFGVNAVMRGFCDLFAQHGYLAFCPDLFWRQKPGIELTDKTQDEWKKAIGHMQRFDLNKGVADLQATLTALRAHPRCTGKAGAVGFCLGGKLAVLMATRTDADASVSYYGVGLEEYVAEYPRIRAPLLVHVAGNDAYATPDLRAVFEPALKASPQVEWHLYEGLGHAFARPGGEHYNADAATLANQRTADFLKRHLGS